jgi:DNA-binding IclR family transcriptional regulator
MTVRDTFVNQNVAAGGGDVPAVAKAIAIIRHLNGHPSAGVTLGDIVERLGMTRSHCHNILRTLVAHGWIEYSPVTRLYRLASGIAADSSTALYARTQLAAVRPYVDAMFRQVGLQCFLSEPLADGSFLIVHSSPDTDAYIFQAPVGYRFPPGTAALFKARLAWLPKPELDETLSHWSPVAHSRNTIMDSAAMREELRVSRQRGYAISVGEYVEGFDTVALPIFDREGYIILIVAISGIAGEVAARLPEVVAALVATSASIHLEIDGRPPVDYPSPR